MQYILTEQEYANLKAESEVAKKKLDKTLQDLCTKVCDNMPIKWDWGDSKIFKPWGCILTHNEDEWYCDQCPVEEKCPHKDKRFSK